MKRPQFYNSTMYIFSECLLLVVLGNCMKNNKIFPKANSVSKKHTVIMKIGMTCEKESLTSKLSLYVP